MQVHSNEDTLKLPIEADSKNATWCECDKALSIFDVSSPILQENQMKKLAHSQKQGFTGC